MRCVNCGKTIPEDAVFCNYCGTKIEIVKQVYTTQENGSECGETENRTIHKEEITNSIDKSKTTKKTVLIVLCVLLCIGIIFFSLKVYKSNIIKEVAKEYNYKKPMSEEDLKLKSETDMEVIAWEIDKELPLETGPGITITKCSFEDYSLVYTILLKGQSQSNYNDESISETRRNVLEELKKVFVDSESKKDLEMMDKYNYDIVIIYTNELDEELFRINIQPSEILI